MGLPDSYRLPVAETAALKLVGDGVAVPAVRAQSEQIIDRLAEPSASCLAAAERRSRRWRRTHSEPLCNRPQG